VSPGLAKTDRRRRRQLRVRSKIRGTAECPRLCVTKTLRHMYAQIIDDDGEHTLVAASTREAPIAKGLNGTGNIAAAQAVGEAIARRALDKGIKQVVFDRAGWPYFGKVKALADAAREAGLEF